MTKKSKLWFLPIILVITDFIMINLSFLLAYWIRFPLNLIGKAYIPISPIEPYLKAILLISFIWLLVFNTIGLYKIKRSLLMIDELFDIGKGITIGIAIVMALSFLYREFSYSRLVAVIAWLISLFLIGGGRVLIRQIQQILIKKGIGTIKTLIIGATEQGQILFERINKLHQLGYEIVGFVDDDDIKKDLPVIDKINNLPNLIEEKRIDEVVVALSPEKRGKILEIVTLCQEKKVKFAIVPDLFEIITTRVGTYEIDGIPLIGLKELPLDKLTNKCIKRAMDIIISAMALTIFAPVMLVIAVLIKFESKGGRVIFKQERVGIDGKYFTIFKFRSMYEGAEIKDNEVGLGLENDPRVTKIGSFLRKTGFDELSQLFNVLKGEMSIVGPRPERLYWVNKFKDQIPRYMERHSIKTGITGWAQANGLRGNTSLQERIRYDLYYLENWSIWLDIKIIIMTLFNYINRKE